ncbi:hypothetical protein Q5692_02825 [Microcoleus sp. C2C3]|uniref:hypothetical protein n=1 Tax=unclassified Microcoleus TaxID=2642155 RepID=UPI002FD2DDE4
MALPAAIGFASYNKKNRPIGRWLSIRDCDVARLRPTQREYANLRDRQKLHAIPQTYTLEETWNLSNLAIAVKSILGVKSVGDLSWNTTRSELKASRSKPKSAQKYCEQPAKITVVAVGRRSKTSYKFSHTIHQKNATR